MFWIGIFTLDNQRDEIHQLLMNANVIDKTVRKAYVKEV